MSANPRPYDGQGDDEEEREPQPEKTKDEGRAECADKKSNVGTKDSSKTRDAKKARGNARGPKPGDGLQQHGAGEPERDAEPRDE